MASIHETAEGLYGAGVMDSQMMRKFDEACLTLFGRSRPKSSGRYGNAKARAKPYSPAT
jgi:hypothetical protein